ncbi:homoserine kinase [Clostridium akagii]|uniref:homoserine kinase n=1 Tax=Clostridium akagii TaxID=91623 RepID=UPI00047BED4A|nr:homoserine kinase [Clostridium akagii]
MIKIKVPASTANIGAGFDCFGLALKLYNEFEFDEIESDGLIFLQNGKPSSIAIEDNLIYFSMLEAFKKYNFKHKGFYINVINSDVPLSRGLGSSATCIAAGINAANYFMNKIMTEQEIINLATKIEGHPDNVVPALIGGFNISLVENNNVVYSKINLPEDLLFVALIPNFQMSTESSRKILPENYSKSDCVFNISRAAMLISSLYKKDFSNLRTSLQDKIHQPFRGPAIKDMDLIFDKSKEFNALGEFISGSGSTLMIIIDKHNSEFYNKMDAFLKTTSACWKMKILEPDICGAIIV